MCYAGVATGEFRCVSAKWRSARILRSGKRSLLQRILRNRDAFVKRTLAAAVCALLLLRAVPQHRQQIQADEMRNALFLLGRLLAPELTAQHAGRCQFRREPGLDHRTPSGKWHLPEQVAGFPGSTYDIFHVAPRTPVTGCFQNARHAYDAQCASSSTRIVIISFCLATRKNCALRHVVQLILALALRAKDVFV